MQILGLVVPSAFAVVPCAFALMPCAFAVVPFAKFQYKLPHSSAPYQRKIDVPLQEQKSRPEIQEVHQRFCIPNQNLPLTFSVTS